MSLTDEQQKVLSQAINERMAADHSTGVKHVTSLMHLDGETPILEVLPDSDVLGVQTVIKFSSDWKRGYLVRSTMTVGKDEEELMTLTTTIEDWQETPAPPLLE